MIFEMPNQMLKPRVAIVGAGFGGLAAAKALAGSGADVTVIDRRNHHLFQPLLYQVATAGLSPADIAVPIRGVLGSFRNESVILGEVTGIDAARRTLTVNELTAEREIPYDHLVLSPGAVTSYFTHPEWITVAPGLKTIEDALAIRRKILVAFEAAETETDAAARDALLTFVLVGGGPTGVELAGSIAELAGRALARDFRRIDPRKARILLLEAGPRVLGAFPEDLSMKAGRALKELGVEVRTDVRADRIDALGVSIGGERIASRTVIWAAGVAATPVAAWLGVEADRSGRVRVNADLSVPGHPEIFLIGDAALVLDGRGRPLPGIAPVAMQQGRFAGRLILKRLAAKEKSADGKFCYLDKGNLAAIGRSSAVAELGHLHVGGLMAWLLWTVIHIYYLIDFRNRFVVMFQWAWSYFTFKRGARLITGD